MRNRGNQADALYARVLDRFLDQASREGELAVARVRAVLVPVALLRLMAMGGLQELLAGHPKLVLVTAVMTLGTAVSWWWVAYLPRMRPLGRWLVGSVVLDAALAYVIFAPMAIWPPDGYPGFLKVTDFALVPLLAVGSGFRLSRGAAVAGALGAMGVCNGMIALDLWMAADQVTYGPASVALAWMVLAASGGLAFALGGRVERLVRAGATEAVRAETARLRLGAYVPEAVAARVMDAPEPVLGGESRQVAVVFTDLRGFTRYAEQVPPDALVQELNAYLDAMVQVIQEEGGVVDKYIGDGIMAVFGVPEGREDDAARAVRAVIRMGQALQVHNHRRAALGLRPLRQGIGGHHGPVVAGHVGTPERLQYTVVGDTVNLASRLEEATKVEGVAVLLTEELVRAAGADAQAALRPLKRIKVRGRRAEQVVWTLRESVVQARERAEESA